MELIIYVNNYYVLYIRFKGECHYKKENHKIEKKKNWFLN